jgi:hypothetical protein
MDACNRKLAQKHLWVRMLRKCGLLEHAEQLGPTCQDNCTACLAAVPLLTQVTCRTCECAQCISLVPCNVGMAGDVLQQTSLHSICLDQHWLFCFIFFCALVHCTCVHCSEDSTFLLYLCFSSLCRMQR